MAVHVGSRVKWLIENNYKQSKKDFAKAIGLKEYTSLFLIFKKENLSTTLLNKIAIALGMSVVDILKEGYQTNVTPPTTLEDPKVPYNNLERELKALYARTKDLEYIIELKSKEIARLENALVEEKSRTGKERAKVK